MNFLKYSIIKIIGREKVKRPRHNYYKSKNKKLKNLILTVHQQDENFCKKNFKAFNFINNSRIVMQLTKILPDWRKRKRRSLFHFSGGGSVALATRNQLNISTKELQFEDPVE